jgi:hypothetical protein
MTFPLDSSQMRLAYSRVSSPARHCDYVCSSPAPPSTLRTISSHSRSFVSGIGQSGGLAFHARQALLFTHHFGVAAAKTSDPGGDIAGRVEALAAASKPHRPLLSVRRNSRSNHLPRTRPRQREGRRRRAVSICCRSALIPHPQPPPRQDTGARSTSTSPPTGRCAALGQGSGNEGEVRHAGHLPGGASVASLRIHSLGSAGLRPQSGKTL